MAQVSPPRSRGMTITWLGHATVLLETAGARLLTDPAAAPPRDAPTPPRPGAGTRTARRRALSHLHHDHLDMPSLAGAPGSSTPPGGAVPRSCSTDGVREVRWGEADDRRRHASTSSPPVHDGRRRPLRRASRTTLGFVVEAAVVRTYFAGDTELFAAMRELHARRRRAGADLGLGAAARPRSPRPGRRRPGAHAARSRGSRSRSTGAPSCRSAIAAATQVLKQPPLEFARHVAELAPSTRVATLSLGESLTIE